MIDNSHHHIEAFIEPDQFDWIGDGVLCQLITVMMVDDLEELDPAVCALTPEQARSLAFRLLVIAEHAAQLTREQEEER
jgi:hypothetical protein